MTEDTVLTRIAALKWPEDRRSIAKLSLVESQIWASGIDPRALVFLGNDPEFKKFWFRHYLLPVRIRRFFLKLSRPFRAL